MQTISAGPVEILPSQYKYFAKFMLKLQIKNPKREYNANFTNHIPTA